MRSLGENVFKKDLSNFPAKKKEIKNGEEKGEIGFNLTTFLESKSWSISHRDENCSKPESWAESVCSWEMY